MEAMHSFWTLLVVACAVAAGPACGSVAPVLPPPADPPSHLFVADGRAGLVVFDVEQGVEVGQLLTPGLAMDVLIDDTTAYVPDFDGGLVRVDIAQPTTPAIIDTREGLGLARDVVLWEDYALVAATNMGLQALDLTTPDLERDGWLALMDARSVALWGDIAIVAGQDLGLMAVSLAPLRSRVGDSGGADAHIWDPLLDPEDPDVDPGDAVLWRLNATSFTYAVTVEGDLLYVADYDTGVYVYDLAASNKPVHVVTLEAPGRTRDVRVANGIAYVAGNFGLWIVDVTDPNAPYTLSLVGTDASHAQAVGVQDDWAAIADGADGMQFFDVSDRESPQHLGTWNTTDANGVALR